ncbi:uncharacterized protein PV09_00945 [Verruconis gallopava]|uniref:Trichodiene oxygenase n=1 Tax=Verruconis gallopava TaxID=253628 RepID=A0A0D2B9W5_9PEZI|nr:uncharacterized protein PV09_00945 [Verruconis gallopava]KIW07999.1 hypothetical protein PV09_00945 [Verruconis gallopava]
MLKLELSWSNVAAVAGIYAVYSVAKAIYRVTLHPLARFPGPLLAALTYKYEWYYDGFKDGQYTAVIAQMHEKYGPVVRINPEELHCNDPAFIDTIYVSGNKRRHKSQYFLRAYGPTSALGGFATADHDHHRLRRGAVNRFFSKASITNLNPTIHDLTQRLCNKLLERSPEPFDITNAYSCFTTDVVTFYCFGQKKGFLDQDDFVPNLRNAIIGGCKMLPTVRQWPTIFGLVQSVPEFVPLYQIITEDIRKIKDAYEEGREKAIMEQRSIFIDILESDLPPSEKTVIRLGTEATTMISAGTETTAWTLTVLTVYLKSQPEILAKLTDELNRAVEDPKNLPSCAVILEGIRLSYGVATRLARIAPDEVLVYEGTFKNPKSSTETHIKYSIPRGTPIGMSSALMNVHPDIFPEPHEFKPERWLNADGTRRKNLEGYLLSFSKGSRQCLGMNLAYCELYIALSALVLRVFPHLKLYETSVADVEFHHDCFVAGVRPESKGVRVVIE